MGPEALLELAERLYPIPRSLTGDGVRRTFDVLDEVIPLTRTEVPAGSRVYDWIVPPEWKVAGATLRGPDGELLADAAANPLHLVGYSEPVRATVSGADLRPRLHALPEHPDWIPYRTSYYERTWGFCVTQRVLDGIDDEQAYEVAIDTTLDDRGSLTYAECLVPGSTSGEILVVTHVCHPNLANDGVAGLVVAAAFARSLRHGTLRRGVRVLFAPSGIGMLAWLERNEAAVDRIVGGVVVSCAGDRGPLTYKRSRYGDAAVDGAAERVLASRNEAQIVPFVPWGGDERQFSSPGFGLAVGALSRTPHGFYPEYHSSADDLSILSRESLADSLEALGEIVAALDRAPIYRRVEPHGEPHLARHSLSGAMTPSLLQGGDDERRALFWVLSLADGKRDLAAIAARAELPYETVSAVARTLEAAGIISEGNGTTTERGRS